LEENVRDKLPNKGQAFALAVVALISGLLTLLDFTNMLQGIPSLSGRSSEITFLLLGITLGYLAVERRSRLTGIERALDDIEDAKTCATGRL
jgi:ABC-type transport system involved in cytochrome c biogenesis permease subunit